jgi:hypothetical protein
VAAADQRDLLSRVVVPALLICGERDARSPLGVVRQFEQAIPDAELVVIAGCGHVSNLERPEQLNQAVRQFCRATSPASLKTYVVPQVVPNAGDGRPVVKGAVVSGGVVVDEPGVEGGVAGG